MKRILSSLLLVFAIYILYEIFRMKQLIQASEKLIASTVPFSQRATGTPSLRILIAGDSTGVGVGADTPAGSLAGLVGQRYPNAEIKNISVSGAKIHDVIQQLEGTNETVDLLFIHAGGNDTIRLTNLTELRKDIQRLLNIASRKSTHILVTSSGNVGTAPLFPAPLRWLLQQRTIAIRDLFIQSITPETKNIHYTDLYREPDIDPFAKEPTKYYAADFFHPSDAGYLDWFSFMSKELDRFPL